MKNVKGFRHIKLKYIENNNTRVFQIWRLFLHIKNLLTFCDDCVSGLAIKNYHELRCLDGISCSMETVKKCKT